MTRVNTMLKDVAVLAEDGMGCTPSNAAFVKNFRLKFVFGFKEPEEFELVIPKKTSKLEVIKSLTFLLIGLKEGMREFLKPEEQVIESMRPCKATYYDKGDRIDIEGRFHRWATNYEEFESGPGLYPVALVEEPSGQVRECIANSVKFEDVN
jgi:hypothetical protein